MSGHKFTPRIHDRQSSVGPATGSNATFMCSGCNTPKLAAGRRRVGKRFWCLLCWTTAQLKAQAVAP